MESHTFKSVTFGGFDKQDVAEYIERASREAAERQAQLEQERDSLRERTEELEKQTAALRLQAEAQSDRVAELQSALEDAERRAAAAHDQEARVAELTARVAELTAQADSLRSDAESYRQFRNRIGDIECEARSRAAELENATHARLREAAERFREQYQALSVSFDAASDYITGELRKVEVNLTQLPRALDQIGAELDRLDGTLEDGEQ